MTKPIHAAATVHMAICQNPIFVIGSPRSGTTILATSLGQHSQLWCSEESDFLFDLFGNGKIEAAYERAILRPKATWLKANETSQSEFLTCMGYGINALFTSRSGAKRWIEQTPHYSLIADILAEMFPGAKFVHILRDARRVVHSMINVTRRYSKDHLEHAARIGRLPPWPEDFRSACIAWRSCVDKALTFCRKAPTRGITASYEALVNDPVAEFAVMQDFLDVHHEEAPARFMSETRINSSFHRDYSKPMPSDQAAEPWKEWPLEHKVTFLRVLGKMLLANGFMNAFDLGATNYDELVQELVVVLEAVLPKGTTALIISKGDERLTSIDDRTLWHFPRDTEGYYSGENPESSRQAIEQLELLHRRGAEWLIIPHPYMWWLEHYHEFTDYLDRRCQRVFFQKELCTVYSLRTESVL